MRVVFACGGTGGHINPAIAVARLIKDKRPDSEILFIGSGGMENRPPDGETRCSSGLT